MEGLAELPNFLSRFEIPDFKALCGVHSSLPRHTSYRYRVLLILNSVYVAYSLLKLIHHLKLCYCKINCHLEMLLLRVFFSSLVYKK